MSLQDFADLMVCPCWGELEEISGNLLKCTRCGWGIVLEVGE